MAARPDLNNGFTALRLLAAYSVILTHSYVVLGLKDDWLQARGFPQFSEIGVAVFFALSGFLVCHSLRRNPDPLIFLRNRALRIFPGLAVLTLVTVFVVMPFVAHGWNPEWFQYFDTLTIYRASYYMPWVFSSNPTEVVNGSLWTLALEVTCYLMLLGVSWSGALNWKGTLLVFGAFASMLFGNMLDLKTEFMGFSTFQLVRVGIFFWGGAVLATVTLPKSWALWSTVLLAVVVPYFLVDQTYDWHYRQAAYYILLPFVVNFAAVRATKLAFLNRFDFSYGIYIYAFLVQQILVARYGTAMHPITLSAITIVITTPIAAASWHLVEKPALALKDRFRRSEMITELA